MLEIIYRFCSIKSEKWKSVFFNMKKKFPVQAVQNKLYNINWKEQIFGMGKLLLGGGTLFLIGDVIFVWWMCQSNERRINETMKNGTRPQLTVSEDEYVPRPKDIKHLKVHNLF